MNRLIRQLLALVARIFARDRQAMLLPIQTRVVARHVLPLARLASELGITVYYTLPPRLARSEAALHIRKTFTPFATEIKSTQAYMHRWTLIVAGDHGHFGPLLLTGSPVVHIGHGNPSKIGQRNSHLPWEYGHAPRTWRRNIAYQEMIESSDCVKAALVETEPKLAFRIRVLGRLLDDELLVKNRSKKLPQNLHELNLPSDKPLLLVVSTIREHSLFGMYWHNLLLQLGELSDRYHILLCPHPNEYATWAARLGQSPLLHLLPEHMATEQVLQVTDALITDFSSICQKAALLSIPTVFSRCEPLPVWPQGATMRLYTHWPVWDGTEEITPLLEQAISMRNNPALKEITAWVNSRPGQARKLHSAWLRKYFPATTSNSAAIKQQPRARQANISCTCSIFAHKI